MWKKILEKIPHSEYTFSQSRTSIWRRKKGIGSGKKLYFGIGLSFNIDNQHTKLKNIYKKQIETTKQCLNQEELDFIYSWIIQKYKKISKNISIQEVNSPGKLFMHTIFVLPYIKDNFKQGNVEGFIARTLYNCTRSWYTNFCKKGKNEKRYIND